MTVYHVRQRLSRRGGSQFYRDRRERKAETFCGAACTEYDAAWADRKRAGDWIHTDKGLFTCCAQCKALAAKE